MTNDMANPEILRSFAIGDFQDAIVSQLLGICVKYDKRRKYLDIYIFIEGYLNDDIYEALSEGGTELLAHFSWNDSPFLREHYVENAVSPLKCDGVWVYIKPGVVTKGGLL